MPRVYKPARASENKGARPVQETKAPKLPKDSEKKDKKNR